MRFCRRQGFTSRDSRNSIAGTLDRYPTPTHLEFMVAPFGLAKGYPIPLSKKSCARVVTYRQCADQHFEKTPPPRKREYFMNFFFSNCAESCSYYRVSIRRADSTPCHPIPKAAAVSFAEPEPLRFYVRASMAVAPKLRHAIT